MDIAQESSPANADFRTLPADISTGGGPTTILAASNQMLLYIINRSGLYLIKNKRLLATKSWCKTTHGYMKQHYFTSNFMFYQCLAINA